MAATDRSVDVLLVVPFQPITAHAMDPVIRQTVRRTGLRLRAGRSPNSRSSWGTRLNVPAMDRPPGAPRQATAFPIRRSLTAVAWQRIGKTRAELAGDRPGSGRSPRYWRRCFQRSARPPRVVALSTSFVISAAWLKAFCAGAPHAARLQAARGRLLLSDQRARFPVARCRRALRRGGRAPAAATGASDLCRQTGRGHSGPLLPVGRWNPAIHRPGGPAESRPAQPPGLDACPAHRAAAGAGSRAGLLPRGNATGLRLSVRVLHVSHGNASRADEPRQRGSRHPPHAATFRAATFFSSTRRPPRRAAGGRRSSTALWSRAGLPIPSWRLHASATSPSRWPN